MQQPRGSWLCGLIYESTHLFINSLIGLSLSVKLPMNPKALPCHSHSVWEGKSVSQGAVLPPTWDDRRRPALVKSEPVLAKSEFAIVITTQMQDGFFSCCRAGKDLTCITDGDVTFLGVTGVAHGHTRLQRVRDGVHHHNHGGCSLVTAVLY